MGVSVSLHVGDKLPVRLSACVAVETEAEPESEGVLVTVEAVWDSREPVGEREAVADAVAD